MKETPVRKAVRLLTGSPVHLPEENEPKFLGDKLFWLCVTGFLIFLVCMLILQSESHAYTDEQAINCLIGEAGNQGLIGMTAVAEVIRARGSLKGIYGCKANHIKYEPQWVRELAGKAWALSISSNYTKGARYFENVEAFGVPYWAKNMKVTFKHKNHTFFKEI